MLNWQQQNWVHIHPLYKARRRQTANTFRAYLSAKDRKHTCDASTPAALIAQTPALRRTCRRRSAIPRGKKTMHESDEDDVRESDEVDDGGEEDDGHEGEANDLVS